MFDRAGAANDRQVQFGSTPKLAYRKGSPQTAFAQNVIAVRQLIYAISA
jgi:hypothetical protein